MSKLRIILLGLSCIGIGFLLGNTKSFSSIVKAAGELWSSNGDSIYNSNSGKVSIGSVVPVTKLTLAESTAETSTISGDLLNRAIGVYGNGGAYFLGRDVTNDIEFLMGSSSLGTVFLGSSTAHDLQLRTNNVTRLTLKKDNGRLGLGLSNPASLFHIYQNNSLTGADSGMTIEQDGTGDAKLQYLLSDSQRWVTGIDNSDGDKFKIGRGTDWASGPYIIMDTSGNVIVKLGN